MIYHSTISHTTKCCTFNFLHCFALFCRQSISGPRFILLQQYHYHACCFYETVVLMLLFNGLLLYRRLVRDPRANYRQSLEMLRHVKRIQPNMVTKSSLMLGLGETDDEVLQAMKGTRIKHSIPVSQSIYTSFSTCTYSFIDKLFLSRKL